MDAIRVNIRSDGAVSNKAVFVALANLPDGTRDVPGLWFQAIEAAFPQTQVRTFIVHLLRRIILETW